MAYYYKNIVRPVLWFLGLIEWITYWKRNLTCPFLTSVEVSCDLAFTKLNDTGKMTNFDTKVEKILKGNLDLIPSPSVKIQIMGGKVCLRCKGKTLLGDVNKLFVFKSLLTMPSNVLPLHLKQTFPSIIWIFTEGEGDGIESRLSSWIFSTLPTFSSRYISNQPCCVLKKLFQALHLKGPNWF